LLREKELLKGVVDKIKEHGVSVFSLHPGVVRTELTRYMGEGLFRLFPFIMQLIFPLWIIISKSSREGAQTTIHCAVASDLSPYTGCYFTYYLNFPFQIHSMNLRN
jgi:retinol dehydrogenase-13